MTAAAKNKPKLSDLSPEQLLAYLGPTAVKALADEADSQLLKLAARTDLKSFCQLAGFDPSPHHGLLLSKLISMSGGQPTLAKETTPVKLMGGHHSSALDTVPAKLMPTMANGSSDVLVNSGVNGEVCVQKKNNIKNK